MNIPTRPLVGVIPGWPDSFRGRYLYLAALLCLVLVPAALVARMYLEQTSDKQFREMRERSAAASALTDVVEQLRKVETGVQRLLIDPRREHLEVMGTSFGLQVSAARRLSLIPWVVVNPARASRSKALLADSENLAALGQSLVELRLDVGKWFPAMEIMQTRMFPQQQEFVSTVSAVIETLDLGHETQTDHEAYETLVRLRSHWQQMIAEFRLLLVNRFGALEADSDSAMGARVGSIEIYRQGVNASLLLLSEMQEKDRLGMETSVMLADLQGNLRVWWDSYQTLIGVLESEGWRPDLVLLRERIEPVIVRIRQRLATLHSEMGAGGAREIARLTDLASTLTHIIVILAASAVILLLGGYVVFNRNLVRPIVDTARALKAEAKGMPGVVVPPAQAAETRDLIDAFNEMREQVHSREQRLNHMAHHDALTRLPNRSLFRDRLERALSRAARDGRMVGVMFLDLDRFKQINDTLGHAVGDKLLSAFAQRLRGCVRTSDIVARLAGDEFGVVVEDLQDSDEAESVARALLETFEESFRIERRDLRVTSSIGISIYPLDAADADGLLMNADVAMYHSKEGGRGIFKFFSEEMSIRASAHLELENQLHKGLAREQFSLELQPIVDVKEGRVYGCEALLRWEHPVRGRVGPDEFVPVLDETGLIEPVSRWAITHLVAQRGRLVREGLGSVAISVNLSGRLLNSRPFMNFLVGALDVGLLPPEQLLIEITEDALIRDLSAAQASLQRLEQLGARIALDDFGTGQSSLNHLRRFPIEVVKIDRDFIRDAPASRYDADLVRAIVAFARSLDVDVVAEGVETEEQREFLKEIGCRYMQGYLVSRPLSLDDFIRFMRTRQGAAPLRLVQG